MKKIIILLSISLVTLLATTDTPDYNTCAEYDIMSMKALDSATEWMDIAEVGKGEGTDIAEKRAEAAEKVYEYHHSNYLNCLENSE